MRVPAPLGTVRRLRRYRRVLAEVGVDAGSAGAGSAGGGEVVAHCANPGSMLGLAEPGARVWLSPADNPARKLRWSWELVEAGGCPAGLRAGKTTLVGIHTGRANALVAEAQETGRASCRERVGKDV